MWSRVELKEKGKTAFKRNYWRCVLVSFILLLLAGGTSRVTNSVSDSQTGYVEYEDSWDNDFDIGVPLPGEAGYIGHGRSISSWIFGIVAAIIFSGIALMIILLKIFVFQPLEIGGCRFFMENTGSIASAERMLFAFKSGYYGKMVLTMFLKGLYTFLWSLLFIIPGIIKAYEYRMIPYLLADCPEMSREDAFRISKEMMYGQKAEVFLLDLSFIGWYLLTMVTCGLLEIFYVAPYVNATNAELFLTLRAQYLQGRN
ncbi:MAG: DUF975 family protein [Eubacteriales bacterium]|nr:DUF975 family protein [Eubacteriales bacterium]